MGQETDNRVYIILADYGPFGRAFIETEVGVSRQDIVDAIVSGEHRHPLAVYAFDPTKSDVSAEITEEIKARYRSGVQETMAAGTAEFLERNSR